MNLKLGNWQKYKKKKKKPTMKKLLNQPLLYKGLWTCFPFFLFFKSKIQTYLQMKP